MSEYFIHIDSSTEKKEGTNVCYGKSTAAWTIFRKSLLIKTGLIYSYSSGPNRILYDAILSSVSSLESEHFFSGGYDSVYIYLDSTLVIEQLRGIKSSIKLQNHLRLVRELCERHKNVDFDFSYKNESDAEFKKVDILSKQGRIWLPKIITK